MYARYRDGSDGDFGRQQRQQQLIRALISKTSGMDVVGGAIKLHDAVNAHFKPDLSPTKMVNIANDYRSSCTASTLGTASVEATIETHLDPMLNLDLSYVILDRSEIDARVEWLLEDE